MPSTSVFAATALFLSLSGCGGDDASKKTITMGKKSGECTLSFDGLDGTEWVYLRANPDRTDTPDPMQGRMKFSAEAGSITAKYNVGSRSDMYEYECDSPTETRMICREKSHAKDYCQALAVAGKTCTPESLRAIDPSLSDDEVAKGIAEGMANVEKYKGTPKWKSFVFNNNNLGNKLFGQMYVKVNKRNCSLRVTDNYITVYNGKKIEDSNPNGTNEFVKNELGELLWEHCTESSNLLAIDTADFPKDPQNARHQGKWSAGKAVNFWYLGADAMEAPEGCSYNFDTWVDGKPLAKAATPGTHKLKGKAVLTWHFANTWDKAPAMPVVVTMVRNKVCAGKSEVDQASCAAVLIQ
jgi:hypothetical protein